MKKNARRTLVTLVAAMSMLVAMVGSAFAQYPPVLTVICDDTSAGATANCDITGYPDGQDESDVQAQLLRAGSAAAPGLASTAVLAQAVETLFDATVPVVDNAASISFQIPADAAEGDQLIVIVDGVAYQAPITDGDDDVAGVPAVPGATTDQLPRTGLEVGVLIAIALAAVVVGGGALAAAKRKGNAAA